jgi:DNA-binding response OmpR family regulator
MSRRILIVEDSLSQAAYLQHYFEEQGYSVLVIHTGLETTEVAENYNPDLIVLDYNLPDIDGIEVCKNLKRDLYLRIIPVVMHSSESKLRNMVKAYEAGADYYVVKDRESDRVLQLMIENILRRKSQRLEMTRPAIKPFKPRSSLSA